MSNKIHKMEKIDIAETEKLLEKSKNAVFVSSCPIPDSVPTVVGYDFNKGVDYHSLFQTYKTMGFQATSLGQAIDEINQMIQSRNVKLSDETDDKYENDIFIKRRYNCTIFLGYTSNLVSSGLRETIRFLVEHNMVDAIVTTAGGIEEDFIKCLAPTYLGEFHYSGKELRDKGINRIGNLMVPNDNYCKFEDWLMPILDELLQEQQTKNVIWSPSKVIQRLGEKIDNTQSIYYWAAKNHIPVFCPALTDGSLGDMMHFHSFRSPGLIIDILTDLRRLNMMAVKAIHSGMIILGGGVVKHHICNANLMRNGADYAVFINTGAEYDGSDSGASPDEAISWGKIRKDAKPIKVFGEATVLFPIVVAETFAKHFHENKN